MKPVHTVFETSFSVFPQDTNYLYPMLFGGKLLSEMDIASAGAARRALYNSPVSDVVTVAVKDVVFHVGAQVRDLVFLRAELVRCGRKSLEFRVTGEREHLLTGKRELICEGTFIFVTIQLDKEDPSRSKSIEHGLTLDG